MPPEPAHKRTITFIDGQNLYYAVRDSLGYVYPNYDVLALSEAAEEVRVIAREQDRWIKLASAAGFIRPAAGRWQ
jgi:hypothetical protein